MSRKDDIKRVVGCLVGWGVILVWMVFWTGLVTYLHVLTVNGQLLTTSCNATGKVYADEICCFSTERYLASSKRETECPKAAKKVVPTSVCELTVVLKEQDGGLRTGIIYPLGPWYNDHTADEANTACAPYILPPTPVNGTTPPPATVTCYYYAHPSGGDSTDKSNGILLDKIAANEQLIMLIVGSVLCVPITIAQVALCVRERRRKAALARFAAEMANHHAEVPLNITPVTFTTSSTTATTTTTSPIDEENARVAAKIEEDRKNAQPPPPPEYSETAAPEKVEVTLL